MNGIDLELGLVSRARSRSEFDRQQCTRRYGGLESRIHMISQQDEYEEGHLYVDRPRRKSNSEYGWQEVGRKTLKTVAPYVVSVTS